MYTFKEDHIVTLLNHLASNENKIRQYMYWTQTEPLHTVKVITEHILCRHPLLPIILGTQPTYYY